jgi:transitional endoplasmic reticulum ATPase
LAEAVQLKAYGRVDLDGTHRAVVEADWPEIPEAGDDSRTTYLELDSDGESCAVLLGGHRTSNEGRIYLDRYKQRHLGIRDGDPVRVRLASPGQAGKVVLKVPPNFTKRDVVRFIGKPLTRGEKTALYTFGGEARLVEVAEAGPGRIVVVAPSTDVRTTSSAAGDVPVTYEDIGGLDREVERIREVVEYPFRFPELFQHLGVSPPRGIILHGPPGTGKTLIARALANESGARFFSVSGPEIYSKWYGRSEENLRNIFAGAVRDTPSIVVIDELDALVPIREKTHGDQEQRIVATFLTQMDGLKEMKDVVVVGTTNRIDAIDPALRRGGRFELEVHIGVPDGQGRQQILDIHSRRMPLGPDVDLAHAASKSSGFTGADLATLCREAAYSALRRVFPDLSVEGGEPGGLDRLEVCQCDFDKALCSVPPSALKEFLVEIPAAGWDDVGGHAETKRLLVENICHAVTRREAFRSAGIEPARGILLYGPPGTGKTLLARAVASECGAHFISLRGPEIRSRWLGESEERIRQLFGKARSVAPCVIFIDEIDAVVPARGGASSSASDGIVNQLLAEMDSIEGEAGVWIVGATNRIGILDSAVLRPGRFDCLVEVGLPDERDREEIFAVHVRGKPVSPGVDLARLASMTDGLSGAQVAEICRLAAWSALREAGFEAEGLVVAVEHFADALERVRISAEGVARPLRVVASGGEDGT